ncbi:hypothetical protein [Lederbergia lenta]|nr:hypothetical protein [Lederbergia lenta]MCM3110379.1 hypothetical protein [Lederbergia lenta]MEC2324054.1 hypothetical protein [Lederbergia lenta]
MECLGKIIALAFIALQLHSKWLDNRKKKLENKKLELENRRRRRGG